MRRDHRYTGIKQQVAIIKVLGMTDLGNVVIFLLHKYRPPLCPISHSTWHKLTDHISGILTLLLVSCHYGSPSFTIHSFIFSIPDSTNLFPLTCPNSFLSGPCLPPPQPSKFFPNCLLHLLLMLQFYDNQSNCISNSNVINKISYVGKEIQIELSHSRIDI